MNVMKSNIYVQNCDDKNYGTFMIHINDCTTTNANRMASPPREQLYKRFKAIISYQITKIREHILSNNKNALLSTNISTIL